MKKKIGMGSKGGGERLRLIKVNVIKWHHDSKDYGEIPPE